MIVKDLDSQSNHDVLKWVVQGYKAESQRDFPYALECYKMAIDLEPETGLHYFSRGNVYKKMGLLKQAIEDFQQAVILDPKLKRAVYSSN